MSYGIQSIAIEGIRFFWYYFNFHSSRYDFVDTVVLGGQPGLHTVHCDRRAALPYPPHRPDGHRYRGQHPAHHQGVAQAAGELRGDHQQGDRQGGGRIFLMFLNDKR